MEPEPTVTQNQPLEGVGPGSSEKPHLRNKRLATRYLESTGFLKFRIDTVELPNGTKASRSLVEHPGAVTIVPVDREGNVHLVYQYRDAPDAVLLELPAGKLDAGEDPLLCAKRELQEELGFSQGRFTALATFYMTPGFCTEKMYLFLATELTAGQGSPDNDEFLEPARRPLATLFGWIDEVKDAKSLVGLLMAFTRETPGEIR